MRERDLFAGRIEDLIRRESAGESMVFSGFLTPEDCVEAEAICRRYGAPYCLYGGHESCERKMLAVSSFDRETLLLCFPISLIRVSCPDPSALSNRDVLGALMAQGIRREVLGDIIVRDGQVLFFATEHIKEFLIQNVTSIGRQSVQLSEAPPLYEIPAPHFDYLRITVASLRADAVVGGLAKTSREQANQLIDGKSVYLNHSLLEKKTKEVHPGDCLVIRGLGKWIIDDCSQQTRKGRSVLECRKYI